MLGLKLIHVSKRGHWMAQHQMVWPSDVIWCWRFWSILGPCAWRHQAITLTDVNSSPPGQNGHHFADEIFRCIFVNEKFFILIRISPKFAPKGPIDNNPGLVQIMAWHWIGENPLSEPMLNWFTDVYIYGTRGGWVNLPSTRSSCIHSRVLFTWMLNTSYLHRQAISNNGIEYWILRMNRSLTSERKISTTFALWSVGKQQKI